MAFSRFALVSTAVVSGTTAMKCPGSGSFLHASIEVTTSFAASCKDVADEIVARASGTNGFMDPHNGGIYSVVDVHGLGTDSTQISTKRTTNPKKSVGGQLYTDLQIFTLTGSGDSCKVEACSESQGFSVKDFSTNYCDIRNLYCGSSDGCKPVSKDLHDQTELKVSPSVGAGHDFSACIVKAAVAEESPLDAYVCPGSPAWVHAWMEVTAAASANCADVAKEIKARAQHQNSWTDPHNGGIYSLLSVTENPMTIHTQRTANPAKSVGGQVYVDKQVFVLTEDKGGQCKITACSESQGTSVGDFSTNYCDLRNLYCGKADGCSVAVAGNDFATEELDSKKSLGASHDFSKCIVKSDAAAELVI